MTSQPSNPTNNALSLYGSYNIEDDFKEMRQQDKILPRLMLMQGQSKPVMERKAGVGDWIESSGQNVVIKGGESKLIIPLMFWLEWIEWNPNRKDTTKRILNRSTDPNSELAKLAAARVKVKNEQGKDVNKVNETYTFLVLVPEFTGDYENPMLLSFARSGYFPGKQWLNRMRGISRDIGGQKVKVPMPAAAWAFSSAMKEQPEIHQIPVIGAATFLEDEIAAMTLAVAGKCNTARDAIKGVSLATAEQTAETEADHVEDIDPATGKPKPAPF